MAQTKISSATIASRRELVTIELSLTGAIQSLHEEWKLGNSAGVQWEAGERGVESPNATNGAANDS
jgi:hypothetical protein